MNIHTSVSTMQTQMSNPVMLQHLKRWQTSEDFDARNALILSNYKLILKIAHSFNGSRVPFDDLVHTGVLALVDACNNYNFQKASAPSAYFYTYIKGYILNNLNIKFNQFGSLDESVNEDGQKPIDLLVNNYSSVSPAMTSSSNDDIDRLRAKLELLSDREQTIIKHMYEIDGAEKMTLEELGKQFKMTKVGILKIKRKALAKIAKSFKE